MAKLVHFEGDQHQEAMEKANHWLEGNPPDIVSHQVTYAEVAREDGAKRPLWVISILYDV